MQLQLQFDSVAEFIAMGNHGVYVWAAYGASALLIITSMVLALRMQSGVRKALEREQRRDAALARQHDEVIDESGS